MTIAIVEDEPIYMERLQAFLKHYQKEFGRPLEVSCYTSGVSLLRSFSRQFDIILLDVAMPVLDGIETARRIRETDSDVAILFVTNQAQFAIHGYEVDAMDYILKPITYFAFSQRLNRAVSRLTRREQPSIFLSLKDEKKKLEIGSIRYVESVGHNLVYHTAVGDFIAPGSLKDAEQALEGHGFLRCNKGYLVALRHVDAVKDGCVVVGGESLIISRPRKAAFLEALTDYLGGGLK